MNTQTPEPALDDFTMAYILCAFWTFDDDAPSGDYETSGRFQELFPLLDRDTILKMADDCARFQKENAALITQAELSESRAGHCFWLSWNRHGSGFFDEYSITECPKFTTLQEWYKNREDDTCPCRWHTCKHLQESAHKFNTVDLYFGDDGKIYA